MTINSWYCNYDSASVSTVELNSTMNSRCVFIYWLTALLSVQHLVSTSADLTEFLWSHDEVSGIYKNEDGSLGIKFTSQEGFLQINTLNSVTIVHFDSRQENG